MAKNEKMKKSAPTVDKASLPALQKKSNRGKAALKKDKKTADLKTEEKLTSTKKEEKASAPKSTKKTEKKNVSAPERKKSTTTAKKEPATRQRTQKSPKSSAENKAQNAYTVKKDENAKVRIIPLGGLNEIGKNMTAIECGDDIIVIDCGLAFPDDEMPGVDLVIPDVTYLEANASKLRGIVLTHGHEDHIGAIPYVLRNINPPIYGTRLTVGIVRNKLKEFTLDVTPKLVEVKAGDVIRLGGLTVEFIHVNHSIADACALAIRTPLGTIVHSGDFKLDLTPIDGEIMDITRLGEIGR